LAPTDGLPLRRHRPPHGPGPTPTATGACGTIENGLLQTVGRATRASTRRSRRSCH